MQGTAVEAIPLLEGHRHVVAPGGLGHQFEASYLSVLAECYLQAGREADAEATAEAALASSRRARAHVWELRSWVSWMELPVAESRRARSAEGMARMEELIERSGAESYRPFLWLAREKWAIAAAEKKRHRAAALQAFEKIGANGHLQRLRA
jgi:hypothetical protein